MAPLGRRITELASRYTPEVQAQVQETLGHLASMSDHGVLYWGQDAYAHLDKLWQELIRGDVSLHRCAGLYAAWKAHVHQVLSQASLRAKGPPDDMRANAWSLAFARLVLKPDGGCDLSVLNIVLGFAESKDLAWLPDNAHREDFLIQLQQIAKAGALLGDTVDRMSGTHPLHPSVQATLRLRDFPGENDARRVLALHLWQTLLTAPLQGNMGNCWHVSHDRALHFQPMELLHHLSIYMDCGMLEFNGRAGEKDHVVPAPYPTEIMQLAMKPVPPETFLALEPELVLALQMAMPERRSDVEWCNKLRARYNAEMASRQFDDVPVRAVLERVLAEELGLPVRHLRGVVLPKGEGPKKKLADHQKLSWTVLLAWEAQHVNPLATAWQATVSKYATDTLLMEKCWAPIEQALRGALNKGKRPAGTDDRWVTEQISRLQEAFRDCATLYLDHVAGLFNGSFRLFVRSAGVDPSEGRGTPVRNVRELVALLKHVAQQAALASAAEGAAKSKEGLSCVLQALHSPVFMAAVQGQSKPAPGRSAQGVWLVSAGFGRRGDLGAVVPQEGRYYDHVHKAYGSRRDFWFSAGATHYLVASSIDWRSGKSVERSLRHLLRKWKKLNTGLFGNFNLQTYLENHPGVVVGAEDRDHARHRFMWTPNDPSVKDAWQPGSPSPGKFIRARLKQPMQRVLEQQLTPDEARVWLKKVLAGSQLKWDAPIDSLVIELLQSPVGDAALPVAYTLKDLVSALDRLLARKVNNPFQSTDPGRNGLDVSILNELPGEVPWLVYAHTNWDDRTHAAYGINARTGEITHVVGNNYLRDDGGRRFQAKRVESPFYW
jgi:hypothetical protein